MEVTPASVSVTLRHGQAWRSFPYSWIRVGSSPVERISLFGATISAAIIGQGVRMPVTATIATDYGSFTLSLSQTQILALAPGDYYFDCVITGIVGIPVLPLEGCWKVLRGATYDNSGAIAPVVPDPPAPAPTIQANSTHTFTTQAAHGFAVNQVVSKVGGSWVLADKDGPQDIFVIVDTPDSTHFTVGLSGKFTGAHGFGAEPANLYLGDNGLMTTTPPPAQPVNSSNPRVQLAIATVLDANTIWINPERRAW